MSNFFGKSDYDWILKSEISDSDSYRAFVMKTISNLEERVSCLIRENIDIKNENKNLIIENNRLKFVIEKFTSSLENINTENDKLIKVTEEKLSEFVDDTLDQQYIYPILI